MQETKINWTSMTWGPVSGCDEVSAGCKFCYAQTLAENRRGTAAFPNGFDITMRPWKLEEQKRLKTPSLIFGNSTSDWFHKDIPDSYRDSIFDAVERYPQHRFQVLTKRVELAEKYAARRRLPRNVWLGVTIEHQLTAARLDVLRRIDVLVRFVSAEPLLGPLALDLAGIHWVIGGGESGFHLGKEQWLEARALVRHGDIKGGEARWVPREDRASWALRLRDQCVASGVAFWFKQHGGPKPESGGRLLEGRTWDDLPVHVIGAMPEGYEHRSTMKRVAQVSLPVVD